MLKDITIFNFTGVYEQQHLGELKCKRVGDESGDGENLLVINILNCKEMDGTKCYCDENGENAICQLIEHYSPRGIHFLDNGDYHYLTKFWTDKINEPFSLVVFDNHTDMQEGMFDILSCGGWVKRVMDTNKNLKDVVIIGASQELISQVPDEYARKTLFFSREQISDNPETLEQLQRLQLKYPLYISVDKDVLDANSAVTNWEQGTMPLTTLVTILKCLKQQNPILGVDVCGEPPVTLPLPELQKAYILNYSSNRQISDIFSVD